MTVRGRLPILVLLPLVGLASAGFAAAPPPAVKGPILMGTQSGGIAGCHFSPDGKYLAGGGGEGILHIWEVATGKEAHAIKTPIGFICAVRFSPDGKLVAAGGHGSGAGNSVCVYEAATGKERYQLAGHSGGLRRIVYTPDSKLLISGGFDGVIRVWDLATGKQVREVRANGGMLYMIAISPDGKTVAATADGGVRLFDLASGNDVTRGDLKSRASTAVAWSPDGKLIASGNTSSLALYEAATGRKIREMTGYAGEVSFTAFTSDSRTVVTSSYDAKVRLWEVRTGKLVSELSKHTSWVWGMAIAPDDRTVASCSVDTHVYTWDVSHLMRPAAGKGSALSFKQLQGLYATLAEEDAGKAYEAVNTLASDPARCVPFLRRRLAELKPVEGPPPARLARLIADLDSDEFEVRQTAQEELEKAGPAAGPAMRKAVQKPVSLEVRRRLDRLLARLDPGRLSPEDLTSLRAVQVLEYIDSAEARKLLKELARGPAGLRLTDEAAEALARCGKGAAEREPTKP